MFLLCITFRDSDSSDYSVPSRNFSSFSFCSPSLPPFVPSVSFLVFFQAQRLLAKCFIYSSQPWRLLPGSDSQIRVCVCVCLCARACVHACICVLCMRACMRMYAMCACVNNVRVYVWDCNLHLHICVWPVVSSASVSWEPCSSQALWLESLTAQLQKTKHLPQNGLAWPLVIINSIYDLTVVVVSNSLQQTITSVFTFNHLLITSLFGDD